MATRSKSKDTVLDIMNDFLDAIQPTPQKSKQRQQSGNNAHKIIQIVVDKHFFLQIKVQKPWWFTVQNARHL